MLGWLILSACFKKAGENKWDPYVFHSFTPNSANMWESVGGGVPKALHLIMEYSIPSPLRHEDDKDLGVNREPENLDSYPIFT